MFSPALRMPNLCFGTHSCWLHTMFSLPSIDISYIVRTWIVKFIDFVTTLVSCLSWCVVCSSIGTKHVEGLQFLKFFSTIYLTTKNCCSLASFTSKLAVLLIYFFYLSLSICRVHFDFLCSRRALGTKFLYTYFIVKFGHFHYFLFS